MALEDVLQVAMDDALNEHEYVFDQEQHGVPEYWKADLTGDCEDFALWCREKLAAEGIQSNLVFCQVETGEYHLVLSVKGWIIDNRRRWVIRRHDLPYRWISLGKPDGTWLEITG